MNSRSAAAAAVTPAAAMEAPARLNDPTAKTRRCLHRHRLSRRFRELEKMWVGRPATL
jgi:hypothetical protein